MKRLALVSSILLLIAISAYAQNERKAIRKGNNAFEDKDFVESEVQYRKALETNIHSFKGKFNLADAQFKQEKYDDALKTMDEINQTGLSNTQKAMIYHNKGNALFMQQKFQESIDAYKNALKLNP
ncbi:MAG TPA: tetratricopeptide repeat protein, partial [Tenuifilaceae bacterium]|nr:tetratricopeptide repeat protein [Tenuifilaceae bacterium]